MLIQPKIRGFICTTAHPEGCKQMVAEQINYVMQKERINASKNVLVIGASTGYGLASRIVATFAMNANTIGVFYEKEADEKRTASPGWYNSAAFEKIAHDKNHYAKSINGDAFSTEIKKETADLIEKDLKKIDLLIYSVASPRRIHPTSGQVFQSTLKPINNIFSGKTIDAFKKELKEVSIPPASEDDIIQTVAVMGGEDWQMWIDYLLERNLLAEGFKTVAYSYLGPTLTHAIYKDGTIGRAKEDLKKKSSIITQKLLPLKGEAFVSINKAVVTQASAAIPVVPLYMSILFKVMKKKNIHEGCIEQIYRLFHDYLYCSTTPSNKKITDEEGYIRLDDLEMRRDVQEEVARLWALINTNNISDLTDIDGYCNDFYHLFGFNLNNIDYSKEVEPKVFIDSIG